MSDVTRRIEAHVSDPSCRRLDPFLVPVHKRLVAWAAWLHTYYENEARRLGWPKRTIIARLMREGPSAAAQASTPAMHMPPEIEEVEQAVVSLRGIRGRVIRIFYVFCNDWPVEAQRGVLNMTQKKWERTLGEGRVLVGHLLGYAM